MRILREGVSTIIVSGLIMLAVVSTGLQASTIYDIEMDRKYVSAAKEQLASQYEEIEEKLDIARRKNDVVAAAEYEMMLDTISLIDRRVNIVAIGNQVEQTKEAFIEDQWSKFVAEKIIGVVGWGISRIGFGKVTDTYMKGKNWPPRSNFLTYDPVTDQNVRIILGNRPELTVTRFDDDISDFGKITLEIFDRIRNNSGKDGGLMSPYDAQNFINNQLENIEETRPLPSDIGTYIASSMIGKAVKESGHISDEKEREEFIREWACQRLTELATEQPTNTSAGVDRSEALWAAVNMICGSSSDSGSGEEPAEETGVEIAEETEEIEEESSQETSNSIYEGVYEGELKALEIAEGNDIEVLNTDVAVLEITGDKVTVTMEYTLYWEVILGGDCFATLTMSFEGEGALTNPLSIDLVPLSYNLEVEGDDCGDFKENYTLGKDYKLYGEFIDEDHFEGVFINLDVSFTK